MLRFIREDRERDLSFLFSAIAKAHRGISSLVQALSSTESRQAQHFSSGNKFQESNLMQ
jgi:hypothetical protein